MSHQNKLARLHGAGRAGNRCTLVKFAASQPADWLLRALLPMSCGLLRLALQRLYAQARVCVHWLTAIVASRRCRIPLSRLWLPKAFNQPTEKAAVACAGSNGLACPDGCEESHEMLLPARQKQSSHSSIHSLEPCRFVAPDTVGSSKNRHAKQNGRGSEEALPSAPHRSLVLAMLQCRRWEASWHCLQERLSISARQQAGSSSAAAPSVGAPSRLFCATAARPWQRKRFRYCQRCTVK